MREAHRGEKEFIAQWKDRRTERSRQHAMQTRVAQDSLLREAAEVQELQLFSKQASIKESVSANRVAKERAAAEKREIRIAEASEMRQQSASSESFEPAGLYNWLGHHDVLGLPQIRDFIRQKYGW